MRVIIFNPFIKIIRLKTKKAIVLSLLLLNSSIVFSQSEANKREHILLDKDWRFAFGHPFDTQKDFNNGTSYFSYFAKAGYGDGAAAVNFDDRTWRKLNLPHDWAVEQPFDRKASFSHGFKSIGRNFPDASIGWYRKRIDIPSTDLGRHISIAFDGVFRNSMVWVNGHYLGTEPSGYLGFEYDISEYLNYGGENSIAVRADATMEEGWFYEGAGIYRHVWLNKTNELHIATNGTFVTSQLNKNATVINIETTINNDAKSENNFKVIQTVIDVTGKIIATKNVEKLNLRPFKNNSFPCEINIQNPNLWSIENPYLYRLKTTIEKDGKMVDDRTTTFGIRTIRFDNNEGFFLNGKHVKIMGTNNHQDHAGVGSAMPDGLQEFRIKTLKSFGCNAYRCSHNPPTPELLDACDKLGMLVIDENRLMGTTKQNLDDLKRMVERDRNHPSIISWSIGNEEWAIENNITGARIASTMQAFVKSIDSTRPATAAFSGGIGSNGITTVMDLLGVNYIVNKNTDEEHKLFPNQNIWGTEEGSTNATRGEYFRDDAKHFIPAYDKPANNQSFSIEQGWSHYAARPYLAGMFIWTGFDYRGEPTPYGWPSVTSYFGMLDLCGFPKDDVWYIKSWWTKDTVLHILPHWNWAGKEGQPIDVWVYSNCDEVELFLNKKSLGKQAMKINSHLEWKVNYAPGILEAIGSKNGKKIATDKVQTTAEAVAINMVANKNNVKPDGADIAIIAVDTKDKNGLHVPIADNEISFSIKGPGKIIGVGNGNPTSLEKEKFIETITNIKVDNLKEKIIAGIDHIGSENTYNYDDLKWDNAFKDERDEKFGQTVKALIYRGNFDLPKADSSTTITFFSNNIGIEESIYINGIEVANHLKESKAIIIDKSILRDGKNIIAIAATPLLKKHSWDNINTNPGLFQLLKPAATWKRKLFNGLAQVIVQSTGEQGDIVLTATTNGLQEAEIKIKVK